MSSAKTSRYCKTFMCDYRGERYCCADCYQRADCPNPCLNHPSRCGLENVEKKKEQAK